MLKRIERIVTRIEETLVVLLFLVIVGVVVWSVVCRYVLKIPFLSSEEIARYLMIYCVFFGASVGVKRKAHIGVEAFVQLLKGKAQENVILFGQVFSTAIYAFLCVVSTMMMQHYMGNGEMTTTTNLPMYVIFMCIPISMFLCTFHSFCHVVALYKGETEEDATV